MKTFFVRVFYIIILVLFIDYILGICLDKVYFSTDKGDYGRNNYIATQMNADCIILGSSRAIHHYDPDRIGKALGMSCYNCGDDAMGIITMYGRFKEIITRYTPKVVIYDSVDGVDIYKDGRSKYIGLLRFYKDNPAVADVIDRTDRTDRFKDLLHCYKYNSRIVSILLQRTSNDPQTAVSYRYVPQDGIIDYEIKEDKSPGRQPDVDFLKLSMMQQMMDECKSKGIRLIVCVSPWYQRHSDKAYKPLIDLCKRNNVQLLNHLLDQSFINNPHLFNQPNHLNKAGAELYSDVISEEINIVD